MVSLYMRSYAKGNGELPRSQYGIHEWDRNTLNCKVVDNRGRKALNAELLLAGFKPQDDHAESADENIRQPGGKHRRNSSGFPESA